MNPISQSVLKLSDYFITNPSGETPWQENWAQEAYIHYYLPLNLTRLSKVFSEALRWNTFSGIQNIIDFGAGLGTATLALQKINLPKKINIYLIEKSPLAIKLAQEIFFNGNEHIHHPHDKIVWRQKYSDDIPLKYTLAIFSYSLTELTKLPEWAFNCERLIIVEPSTHQDGRKLLELRQELVQRGFNIYAPCIHQNDCPLLIHSKKDWCHDRVDFYPDHHFKSIEADLPMKNKTLTMSYLIAGKKSLDKASHDVDKSKSVDSENYAFARATGDKQKEKGKDRQLICRNSEREFLSWMHKNPVNHELNRGDLVRISKSIQKISNELRVLKLQDVVPVPMEHAHHINPLV